MKRFIGGELHMQQCNLAQPSEWPYWKLHGKLELYIPVLLNGQPHFMEKKFAIHLAATGQLGQYNLSFPNFYDPPYDGKADVGG